MISTIIVTAFLMLLAYHFIKGEKPEQIKTFPDKWRTLLNDKVEFYGHLNADEKKEFEKRMLHFLNTTFIDGVDTPVEDIDKIYVAASAVIPVFSFPHFEYSNLKTVILYPSTFNSDLQFSVQSRDKRIGGMVGTGRYENQMILSKKSLRAGFERGHDGQNTGVHEFTHLIDKMDGETDGVPHVLMKHNYTVPWLNLIHKEIRRIKKHDSELRAYGATNEAEFFAVASEYFFEKPEKMKKVDPDLYKALSTFFEQNEA